MYCTPLLYMVEKATGKRLLQLIDPISRTRLLAWVIAVVLL